MPHTLIETPTFDDDIVVPDGYDDMHDAAEVVEAMAQKLANRTRWIEALVGNFARRDEPNDFSGTQHVHGKLELEIANATDPLISSESIPASDSVSGNVWKPILRQKHTADQWFTVYAGRNAGDGSGAIAIVTNARWNTATQKWVQYQSTQASSALIWHWRKLRVSGVEAGAAPWDAWPETSSNPDRGALRVAGKLEAMATLAVVGSVEAMATLAVAGLSTLGSLTVTGATTLTDLDVNDLDADHADIGPGTLNVTGPLFTAGMQSSGDVVVKTLIVSDAGGITMPGLARIYLSGPTADRLNWKSLNLADGTATSTLSFEHDLQAWYCFDGVAGGVSVPLPNLPNGCQISNVQAWIQFNGAVGTANVALRATRNADWNASDVALGDMTAPDVVPALPVSSHADSRYYKVDLLASNYQVRNDVEALTLVVSLPLNARLGRARVRFVDVGPRSE